MISKHLFKANLNWEFKTEISSTKIYQKSHQISIENKPDLMVSAAKVFKGDPKLYNPEDLLLSSLTSCHMMSYLYCCQLHKIDIISYTDHSEAYLEVNEKGSGKIVKVILYPEIIITNPTQIDLAISLHKDANELCFIANSCNFEVVHHATCKAI